MMRLGPIHPRIHARACELLGLPVRDAQGMLTPLTEAQMWEAAQIEMDTPLSPAGEDT